MKTAMGILFMVVMMTTAGCGSQNSPQGGTLARDEEFSITVPSPLTIKQGADLGITVLLNRGAYFKRDVQLTIKTEGITVTPSHVVVKASDKPEIPVQIVVPRDAAIGAFRVTVQGMPETGESTSTEFTVNVVPQ